MSVNPKQPVLKSGLYRNESSMFTDMNALFRSFATRTLRPSRTSPPIAADVDELTFVYDKTLNRLYTKVNGTLRYAAFT